MRRISKEYLPEDFQVYHNGVDITIKGISNDSGRLVGDSIQEAIEEIIRDRLSGSYNINKIYIEVSE